VQQGFFAGKVRSGVEGPVTGEGESAMGWCSGASPVAHLLAHPLVLPSEASE